MIIREMHLIHFGKFQDYRIELGPHMNILYGKNEAGKSTIYAFLEAMLFGLKKSRGRASGSVSDLYTRYRPWDSPASFEGSLTFEEKSREYQLYRNFSQGEEETILVCLDDRREIELPHGDISDLIPNLTRENYRNTIGVAQTRSELETQFAVSFQSQTANMTATGSADLDFKQALGKLEKKKREFKKQSSKEEIYALDQKIREQEEELQTFQTQSTQGKSSSPFQEGELTQIAAAVQQEIEESQMRLGRLQGERDILEKEAERLDLPRDGSHDAGRPQDQKRDEQDGKQGKDTLSWVFLFIGALLCILTFVFWKAFPAWIIAFCLVVGILLLVVGVGRRMRANRRKNTADSSVESKQKGSGRKGKSTGSKENTGSGQANWRSATNGERTSAVQTEENLLSSRLKENEESYAKELKRKEHLLQESRELSEALHKCRQAANQRDREREQLQEKQAALKANREKLQELKSKEAALNQELECIDLSMETLKELSSEIYENFGTQLWKKTEKIMEEITGVRRQIQVDEDLQISVCCEKGFLPAERFSQATTEQFSLALRIAAASILYEGEEIFLILDDTFAYYDEDRLQGFLKWAADSWQGQVMIFSCTHRECDQLEAMNRDYNYVQL